ncbi:hypothetical protein GCM10010520_66810 [Rhizobium viscosum]|uniref:Restriction endonuclease n=1 Tax=Rhizobium viscosum TaxID=1673 RepID=A0ABR9ITV1_RHIVS|nr:hypothetical protein [Rhizobium viscosum]MBE1506613.1 hypothetical protein [Rhizobium viscosum]
MKNEPKFEMFRRAFSSRISLAAAVKNALAPSPQAVEQLRDAWSTFEQAIAPMAKGNVEDQYRAYGAASGLFVSLAEWKRAIRNAEPDAQRFLSATKMRASEIDRTASFAQVEQLVSVLDRVNKLHDPVDLGDLQSLMGGWALPLLMFANVVEHDIGRVGIAVGSTDSSAAAKKLDTTVAFLKFDIDGQPAKHWNYLKPETAYDLTIEVRVSNWPKRAKVLSLMPVTIDSRERDWLPKFKFQKPDGTGPFTLTGTGRAVLEIAHSFGSRPYEFLYTAEFDDMTAYNDIQIVGHRRLVLEGSDIATNPLTGFSNVDRHLLAIRNRLRSFPGLNQDDLANAMTVLGGFGSIAASALRDATFSANTSEREFQKETTRLLRMRSEIGGDLHGHPEAAGGITDLTFRDIPIELKVENNQVLYAKDFSKYFDQAAAYALGLGKRLALLSVLESCAKSSPVGNVEEDIDVFLHRVGNSSVAIVVVVVRGGLPKPSFYSKR